MKQIFQESHENNLRTILSMKSLGFIFETFITSKNETAFSVDARFDGARFIKNPVFSTREVRCGEALSEIEIFTMICRIE